MFLLMLSLHLLGAAIWVGGHLVLATAILPAAQKENSMGPLRAFAGRFDGLSLAALLLQILSGLWLMYRLVPAPGQWFNMQNPLAHIFATKLLLLVLSIGALGWYHAKRAKTEDSAPGRMKAPVYLLTTLAVLLVIAGASFRI